MLPKSTVTQHLALQSQPWHAAVLQSLAVILEIHYDAGDDWETVETWTVDVKPWAWGAMLDGLTVPGYAGANLRIEHWVGDRSTTGCH